MNGAKRTWDEYSALVLHEMERLNTCYETLRKRQEDLKTEVVVLKTKATIFGLIAGSIPGIIAVGIALYKG